MLLVSYESPHIVPFRPDMEYLLYLNQFLEFWLGTFSGSAFGHGLPEGLFFLLLKANPSV